MFFCSSRSTINIVSVLKVRCLNLLKHVPLTQSKYWQWQSCNHFQASVPTRGNPTLLILTYNAIGHQRTQRKYVTPGSNAVQLQEPVPTQWSWNEHAGLTGSQGESYSFVLRTQTAAHMEAPWQPFTRQVNKGNDVYAKKSNSSLPV